MVRTFDPSRPVPETVLDRILHDGTRAPSTGFSQGQTRHAEPDKGWTDRDASRRPTPFRHVDISIAATPQPTTAVGEELGTLPFGIVPSQVQQFKDAFRTPDGFEPIGASAVGYDTQNSRLDRDVRQRATESTVYRGMWGV